MLINFVSFLLVVIYLQGIIIDYLLKWLIKSTNQNALFCSLNQTLAIFKRCAKLPSFSKTKLQSTTWQKCYLWSHFLELYLARLLSLRKQIICVITKILCVGSIPFISIVVELLLLHAEQYYPLGSKPTNPNTEGLRAWVNLIPFGQVLS